MAQRKPTVISKLQAKTKDRSLKDFISSLYAETPEHELTALSHDHLLSAAQSTFKSFKVRKKNSSNVDIFLASNDADIAVLQVSCQDTSFLIDSITNELKQQQCEIHLIVHPILFVQRNNSGNFQGFSKDGTRESLMQFHIASLYDEQGYTKLKERIVNILEAVSYTITDWRKMTTRMLESVKLIKNTAALQNYKLKDESVAFLEWLIDNHMVFLGAIEYKVAGNKLIPIEPSRLGVTKSKLYSIASLPLEPQYSNIEPLIIRKWDERSVVHRTAHMDWIMVKKLDSKGNLTGAHMFFGLFTSSVYYQSVRNIPLVRKKIESVIQRYGYSEHSHNCKELLTALESFPRGELLKMSFDELYETSTAIVSLSLIPRIKVFIRKGQNEKFLSCIVFIPEKKFSSEARNVIDEIICGHLKGAISKRYVQVSDSGLVRMQLILKTEPDSIKKVDIKKLEQEITKAISVWSDELFSALQLKFPKKEVVGIYNRYKDAFDIKYKSIFHGSKAIHDIKLIEEALAFNRVRFDIYISRSGSGGKDVAQLKIYSPHQELALSKTLPAIENMGLFALDVFTYKVSINNQAKENAYIHHFRLQTSLKVVDKYDELRSKLQAAFEKVWLQDIDDDRYNSLIITANLSWREVVVARAISKYLKQTDFPYSYELTLEILILHANITQKLIELFNLKFDLNQKRDSKRVEKLVA